MAKFFKYAFRTIIVILIIAAAVAFWKREQIMRLFSVNNLFTQEKIVHNFSNMNTMFRTLPIGHGDGPASALPKGKTVVLNDAAKDWIKARSVTSLLVMKDGQIVNEQYFQGTGANDLRISWSVAKSYLSALLGIMIAEGKIDSIDDKIIKYVPTLARSVYDRVTIRHLLNMSSGVKFNEDYLDYNSDINRMGRVLALGRTMDQFTFDLKDRERAPGEKWQYVSIDTHVIGMVIRSATGRRIPDLLSEKIITPLGLQAEPYYVTDGVGVAFVLGGLNITTRDYARFGQMIANGGKWNGVQIVPQGWIDESTMRSAPGGVGYGYQWWIPENAAQGEFFARGIYGQYIYINRAQNVVIVSTAADRKFRETGVSGANISMFRQIANGL